MFALEIQFKDGVSQSETLLIRRPIALVGFGKEANVFIEDLQSIGCEIMLARQIGKSFRCELKCNEEAKARFADFDGVYDGQADLDLPKVHLHVTALDIDLLCKEAEPPDRAGVRVCRLGSARRSPKLPAVLMASEDRRAVVSFSPDQPVFVGRSNFCPVRIDHAEISSRHARVGFESGSFWIEDLGSTNGTFVNGQQISGRMNIPGGQPVVLGRDQTLVGISSEDQLEMKREDLESSAQKEEAKYPALISLSDVARPARVSLPLGSRFTIGRDPSCDMWLGAPHISRRHLIVDFAKTGKITVVDESSNGTLYDGGTLQRGDRIELRERSKVFNFGDGITVALCFRESDEEIFRNSDGAADAFGVGPGTSEYAEAMFDKVRRGSLDPDSSEGTELRSVDEGALYRMVMLYRSLPLSKRIGVIFLIIGAAMILAIFATLVLGMF